MASTSGQLRRAATPPAGLLLLSPRPLLPPLSLLPLPHLRLLLLPSSSHHGHHWRELKLGAHGPGAMAIPGPDPDAPASPPPNPGLPKSPRALSMPPRPPEAIKIQPWFV